MGEAEVDVEIVLRELDDFEDDEVEW